MAVKGSKHGELGELKTMTPEPNAEGGPGGEGSTLPDADKASAPADTKDPGTPSQKQGAQDSASRSQPESPATKSKGQEKLGEDAKASASGAKAGEGADETKPADPGSAESGAAPPPRPARPRPERRVSGFTSNLEELKTAFPDADADVRRGMLVASSNNLEAAFSGMLALSDPTIRPETYVRAQIEHDERLARRLAMSEQRRPRARRPPSRTAEEPDDDDNSMSEGFQRGLNDTKQAVSSFWGSLKQKINGEIWDEDDDLESYRSNREPREPLRSQWFPRQQSVPRPEPGAPAPKLPARKPSQQSTEEPRSVNAFGDELKSSNKEEPEPDAFFIGESDDDLGSLNDLDTAEPSVAKDTKDAKEAKEAKDAKEADKDAKETKNSKDTEAKTKEPSSGDVSAKEPKEKAPKESIKDAKAAKEASAKDLLTKVKTESEKSK